MEIAKMSLSKSLFSFVRIFLFIIAFVDVCIAVNLNEISSGNEQIELTNVQNLQQFVKKPFFFGDSFYQKVSKGIDVNVLVVGDSIGAGAGSSHWSHAWPNILVSHIKSKYNVEVKLTNISMGGNTSYAGYFRTMALNDGISYDLVILCYGQNDADDNFSLFYESIIRAVKIRYPKASIICILEHSQRDYSEKMKIIKEIADHYEFPIVDTIAAFHDNYDSLVVDGVHPNDEGQKVYFQTVMNVIEPLVSELRGFDHYNVSAVNEQLPIFDTFHYFPVTLFNREGNTFSLQTKIDGIVMGVYYTLNPGPNNFKIFVDGKEYAKKEANFNFNFCIEVITVMNPNYFLGGRKVNIQKEIKVVFSDDETGKKLADGFIGLGISGSK